MSKKKTAKPEVIVSYKGFDKDFKCRGFQYEVGKTYTHEGEVKACSSGFHACEYPLDVFGYYPPSTSRFAQVEQSGNLSREEGDTKVASRSLSVKAELTLPGIISAAIEYTMSRVKPIDPDSPASNSGDYGAASNSGDYGAAINSGYQGAASNSGVRGAASNSGVRGAASNSGVRGAASNSGLDGVAAAFGYAGKAMSEKGGAIVLCYRDDDGRLIHIRSSKVGENGIKEGVWYSLDEDGNFIEV